jgi:two-component system, OmpR family, KDP operon response regulator KdpE
MVAHCQGKLLLADNKDDYRRSLKTLLELHGYAVEESSDLDKAKELLQRGGFDLVLADMRLTDDEDDTDISGMGLAQEATEAGIPCVVVTAFESVEAVLLALRKRGTQPPLAVDFIPKRDGPRAVLDAVTRNIGAQPTQIERQVSTPLVVDLKRCRAWKRGEELDLSDLQYKLLAHLYDNRDKVCSHKEALKAAYGETLSEHEATQDKRLERLVARLREKIEDNASDPKLLISVPGRGFRLVLE